MYCGHCIVTSPDEQAANHMGGQIKGLGTKVSQRGPGMAHNVITNRPILLTVYFLLMSADTVSYKDTMSVIILATNNVCRQVGATADIGNK